MAETRISRLDAGDRDGQIATIGFALWGVFACAIVVLVALNPERRTVMPFYSQTTFEMWRGVAPLVDATHGFYYLPTGLILFTPYALAGPLIGGVLWRLTVFALLTLAVQRWAALLLPGREMAATGAALAMIIGAFAGVLQNGQFDAPMWALIALGAAEIAYGRLWAAALYLTIGFALKPLVIVPILLFGVLWPFLGLRLLLTVAAMLLLPVAFLGPDAFVTMMERIAAGMMLALPRPGPWNDIAGALAHLGYVVPYDVMTVIRAAAAVATLALGFAARTRLGRLEAVFTVMALAVVYLMLFNPRTEGSSYSGLALVTAFLALRELIEERRRFAGGLLIALTIALGLTGVAPVVIRWFGVWLKPTLAIAFLVLDLIPRALDRARWMPLRGGGRIG